MSDQGQVTLSGLFGVEGSDVEKHPDDAQVEARESRSRRLQVGRGELRGGATSLSSETHVAGGCANGNFSGDPLDALCMREAVGALTDAVFRDTGTFVDGAFGDVFDFRNGGTWEDLLLDGDTEVAFLLDGDAEVLLLEGEDDVPLPGETPSASSETAA